MLRKAFTGSGWRKQAAAPVPVRARMPEVEIRKLELDEEDGRLIYELNFPDGNGVEFEAEPDACTGEVLKWEVD